MKNLNFICLIGSVVCLSCGSARDAAQDAITGTLEKVIEQQTGHKVELPDADSFSKNSASVRYSANGEELLTGDEQMNVVVILYRNAEGLGISFQITAEDGRMFTAGLSRIKEPFSLPLTATFSPSNSYDGQHPVGSLVFIKTTDTGMEAFPAPYEGSLTLSELTEKEIVFSIDGKGGRPESAGDPSSWKPVSGKGTLSYPIIQSTGVSKKEIFK